MRIRGLTALVLIAAFFTPDAAAGPVTQDPCPGSHATQTFASGQGVLENLAFDGLGNLYVTGDSKLRRYAPDGTSQVVLGGLRSPGGLAFGADGRLYMGIGNSALDALFGTGLAEVWRLNPDLDGYEVYASGFDMPNGMTFDAAGNLYVSNDFGPHLVRITPGGAWTNWASVYGTNGLSIDPTGTYVDAAITFDQSSPIKRISLAGPSVRTLANLSFGALTLEPGAHEPSDPTLPLIPKGNDDMTRDDQGRLIVTANGSGEVVRVEEDGSSACILASGLRNPSSVRFAKGFGSHTGKLFVTDFGGSMTIVEP